MSNDALRSLKNVANEMYDEVGPTVIRLSQLNALPRHIAINNGSQLLWPIEQWSDKVREAKSGHNTIIYSRPFDTTPQGYRLMAAIAPNGDGKGIL